jgi:hypothetical protein
MASLQRVLGVAFWPVILALAAFWVVLLAGISGLQHVCNDSSNGCGNSLRLPWWLVWFELVLICLSVVVVLAGAAFRPALLCLLAIETALTTSATDLALSLRDSFRGSDAESKVKTAVAGFLMVTLLNLVLICLLGLDPNAEGGLMAFTSKRNAATDFMPSRHIPATAPPAATSAPKAMQNPTAVPAAQPTGTSMV